MSGLLKKQGSTLAILGACAALMVPLDQPAIASGTQTVNPAKVCFLNVSGKRLYFTAMRSGKKTRGFKLSNKAKFCASSPAPTLVVISLTKDGPALCRRNVWAGQSLVLRGQDKEKGCDWFAM